MQLNSTSLQLQFQPSYALHDTVSVDYYIIEVTGVDNDYMSMFNSTSTVVTFSLTDYCSEYTMCITPYNNIGPGEKNIKTGTIVFQGDYNINYILSIKIKMNYLYFQNHLLLVMLLSK